jgi:hypothetical protein
MTSSATLLNDLEQILKTLGMRFQESIEIAHVLLTECLSIDNGDILSSLKQYNNNWNNFQHKFGHVIQGKITQSISFQAINKLISNLENNNNHHNSKKSTVAPFSAYVTNNKPKYRLQTGTGAVMEAICFLSQQHHEENEGNFTFLLSISEYCMYTWRIEKSQSPLIFVRVNEHVDHLLLFHTTNKNIIMVGRRKDSGDDCVIFHTYDERLIFSLYNEHLTSRERISCKRQECKLPTRPKSVAFLNNDQLICGLYNGTVALVSIIQQSDNDNTNHDVKTLSGSLITELPELYCSVKSIRVSPSHDQFLVIYSSGFYKEGRGSPTLIPILDGNLNVLCRYRGHQSKVHAAVWIDSTTVVSGEANGNIHVWTIKQMEDSTAMITTTTATATISNQNTEQGEEDIITLSEMDFSSQLQLLAVGFDSGKVSLYSVQQQQQQQLIYLHSINGYDLIHPDVYFEFKLLMFSPDGYYLVMVGGYDDGTHADSMKVFEAF